MTLPIKRLSGKTWIVIIIIIIIGAMSLGVILFHSRRPAKPVNVIFIIIDALRRDHLGCYGYRKNTSPNIDNFSKDSVIFENAVTASSWTQPSFGSFFTGTYPAIHNCTKRPDSLGPSNITLASVLKQAGYLTCGFVELRYLTSLGFDTGFDSISALPSKHSRKALRTWSEWVLKNRNSRFFLFIHTLEVHAPYLPPAPYDTFYDAGYTGTINGEVTPLKNPVFDNRLGYSIDPELSPEDLRHLMALYDEEIRYIDAILGKFIAELKKMNLYDKSLIIITADHGEGFYEHRMLEHRESLYDELLRIPLIIKFPYSKFKGEMVRSQVRSIDIMPTILEVTGLPINKNIQGESLIKLLGPGDASKTKDRIAFSDVRSGDRWDQQIISVRTGEYKYIYRFNPYDPDSGQYEEELYNIKTDPGETHDLSQQESATRDSMKAMVQEYIRNGKEFANPAGRSRIDKETYKELRRLGYMN